MPTVSFAFDHTPQQREGIRASGPNWPGDGNSDFRVDQRDLDDWRFYATSGGGSSYTI